MKDTHLKISAVVTAMALLVPAAAIAKRPDDAGSKGKARSEAKKPKKPKKTKLVTANVFGTVVSNEDGTMVVTVGKASGQAKACKGKDLSFDVSSARFHTADNNANGEQDAGDVTAGQLVKVRGKVTVSKGRKTTCGPESSVTPAKAVHNRTTPKVEEEEEEAAPVA